MENKINKEIEQLRNHRFIVHFPEPFSLQTWTVKRVEKSPYNFENLNYNDNILRITLINTNLSDAEIIGTCRQFNKTNQQPLEINSLNASGEVITKDYYIYPKILRVSFTPLDYSDNNLQCFTLTFKYDRQQ